MDTPKIKDVENIHLHVPGDTLGTAHELDRLCNRVCGSFVTGANGCVYDGDRWRSV